MVAASVMDIGIGEEMVGVAPAVVDRLAEYFADVASGLVRSEQRWAAEYYARALMMDGARKSLEPMVARIGGTSVEDEGLQHFLADSPWGPAGVDRWGVRGGVRGGGGAGEGPGGGVAGPPGRPRDRPPPPGEKPQSPGSGGTAR